MCYPVFKHITEVTTGSIARPHKTCEAPRPQGGASRKGYYHIHIVSLHPAYPALAGPGDVPDKNPLGKGLEAHSTAFSIQHLGSFSFISPRFPTPSWHLRSLLRPDRQRWDSGLFLSLPATSHKNRRFSIADAQGRGHPPAHIPDNL